MGFRVWARRSVADAGLGRRRFRPVSVGVGARDACGDAAGVCGWGRRAWGAAARSAEPAADAAAAAAEEGRRRKGRKGTVLFEMGGARRY